MTQAEFESLQVGDVIERRYDQYDELPMMVFDVSDGEVAAVCTRGDFGEWYDVTESDAGHYRVVSRVLSRENVQAKGGE